ncbi:MAG TPA: POTRA domain-containing protein, partial [Gemmataceae bacterium]
FSNIQTFTEPDGPGRVKVRMHFLDLPNKVQKVTFLGAKHLKEEDLRKATGVRIDMPLNPNLNRAGCQKILDKYAEQGRSFSSCELIKGGQLGDTEVIYSITEGPKVRVRDVQFIGNTFVSGARLATQIHSSHAWFHLPGGTFNRRMAEADVNELINYFKSFGYKDVKVSLETRPSTDGSEIALIFHIQEGVRQRPDDARRRDRPKPSVESLDGPMEILRVGDYLDENQSSEEHKSVRKAAPTAEKEEQPLARIGHIILTGNKRISDESILAHVSLFPGQVLRYPDLKKAENALAELGLFVVDPAAGVRPTITVLDSGSAYKDILITVKEKRTAGKPR